MCGGIVTTIFGDKDGWDIEVKGAQISQTIDLIPEPIFEYRWYHIPMWAFEQQE